MDNTSKEQRLQKLFEQSGDWPEFEIKKDKDGNRQLVMKRVQIPFRKLLEPGENDLLWEALTPTKRISVILQHYILPEAKKDYPDIDFTEFKRLANDVEATTESSPSPGTIPMKPTTQVLFPRILAMTDIIRKLPVDDQTKKKLSAICHAEQLYQERVEMMMPLRRLKHALSPAINLADKGVQIPSFMLPNIHKRISEITALTNDLDKRAFPGGDKLDDVIPANPKLFVEHMFAIQKQADQIMYDTLCQIKITLEQIFPQSPDLPNRGR